jgi:aerobic carbon-monoxide dehydrogenase large subunit
MQQLGAAVRRVEDPPLITGRSAYTDDLAAEGACHAAFVRSGLAHARIEAVAPEAAAAAPGVLGVFRAGDLGLGSMAPGDGPQEMARPILAGDVVRFLGEPLAVVVAETRAAAVDAVDLVEVEYDPLEVLVDPEAALEPGAPRLFPGHGDNLAGEGEIGEEGALADAEVVVRSRFVNRRVSAAPMEPAAAAAAPDPESGGITLWRPARRPSGRARRSRRRWVWGSRRCA